MSAIDLIENTWQNWFDTRPSWRSAYTALETEFTPAHVEAALEEWVTRTEGEYDLAARPPTPIEARAMLKREAPHWVLTSYPHLSEWGYVEPDANARSTGINDWHTLSDVDKTRINGYWRSIKSAMSKVAKRNRQARAA